VKRAFAHAGFPRLYAALTASALGDAILLLVLSMWVKTLTGSNGAAGITFFFMMIPSLVAPAFGVWIDRVRRRPLLVWGNLASALILLPLLLVRTAAEVWIIWTVAVLYGVSFVVLPAGVNGLLKELLPEDTLVDANAALQTTREGFRLFGPLVGAALFAWQGAWLPVVLDAASFVVAAVLIAGLRLHEDRPVREEAQIWDQVTAGVRHLVGDPVLRHTLVGFGLMLLVIGFTESSIYALLDGFDRPPTFAGVVVTVQGVGAVAGGLSSNLVVRRIGEVATCVLGLVLMAVPIAVISLVSEFGLMLALVAFIGLALPLLFVSVTTLVQRRTPQAIMGRTSMALEVVMGAPQALSLAAGALLVTVVSWRILFAAIAVVTLAGAAHISFWLRRHIREEVRAGGVPEGQADPTLDPLPVVAGVEEIERPAGLDGSPRGHSPVSRRGGP